MVMAVVAVMSSVPLEGFVVLRGFDDGLDFGGGGGGSGSGGGGGGRGVVGPATLVLDREKGELVKAPVRIGRRGVGGNGEGGGGEGSEVRAALALKSHSDAERRRRERINSHLSTLRGLLPTTVKMDKAAVLAEVITQVRQLKRAATEVSKTCTAVNIPSCIDEVQVENYDDESIEKVVKMKASLSCDDRPEIFADLKQALETLRLRTVSAEISTIGSRLKTVFVLSTTCREDDNGGGEGREVIIKSVQNSLRSVVERVCTPPPPQPNSSPATSRSGKRRKFLPPLQSMSCSLS